MNDLNDLLERAAGPLDARATDAHADLTRGRRALGRTRARRTAVGLAGVAAAGVVGVALTRGGDDVPVASDPSATATPTQTPTPGPTTAPTPSTDGIFAFGSVPPDGWTLQGAEAGTAVFAHPGDTTSMYDFEGKIVLMLDTNRPAGEPRQVGGRTFWVAEDTGGGYMRVSTRTRPQEPQAVLSVQLPRAIGWPTAEVIRFLNDVQVLSEAQPVVG